MPFNELRVAHKIYYNDGLKFASCDGMNKKLLLTLVALVCFSTVAQANLISPPTLFSFNDQSDGNIIANVSSTLGVSSSSVIDLLRLDNLAAPGSGSPFSVTYGTTGQATVSWNLTGTGDELLGVYVFGGSHANLYLVSGDELVSSGSAQSIVTPLNNGGQTPGISHIVFLGESRTSSVPDGGSTIALLGAVLIGLAGFRAKFKNANLIRPRVCRCGPLGSRCVA